MKLHDLQRSVIESLLIREIWRSPTRILKRVNARTVRSTSSDLYSPTNTIDPNRYFKKSQN